MKRFLVIYKKSIAFIMTAAVLAVNLIQISGIPAAGSASPVTVDFTTDSSMQSVLSSAYDYSRSMLNTEDPHGQGNAFSTGQAYYTVGGKNHTMLSLSYWALKSLDEETEIAEPGYYVAYNVEPGSEINMTSVRKSDVTDKITAAGYDYRFSFYVSRDYEEWSEVTPEISTGDLSSSNGYNRKDTYSLKIPEDAAFLRIVFPQKKNMSAVVNDWGSPGNYQYGAIETLTFTPASSPAPQLAKYIEPELSYAETIDFSSFNGNVYNALQSMYSYTDGVFSVSNASYTDLETDEIYQLFSLTADSLKGKSNISPLYNIVYYIEPGTPLRLEGLHRERESEKIIDRGRNYRFNFYTSADGISWTEASPDFYRQDYFETKKVNNVNYNNKDIYVIIPPADAKFIKIEFPQDRDNTSSANGGANMGNCGDWAVATIKSIKYTPAAVAPPRTVDFLRTKTLQDELSRMYDYSAEIASDDPSVAQANVFALGEAVYNSKADGKSYPMLSLAYKALYPLPADKDTAEYYITYNVESGSPFRFASLREEAQTAKITASGLNYRFKIYVSADNKSYTQLSEKDYSFSTGESNTNAPYDSQDIYSFTVPENMKFVKIVFPQSRNLSSVLGGSVGNWEFGTISMLTYTPALKPAVPISEEPEGEYSEIIDFSDEDNDIFTFLSETEDYSDNALSVSDVFYTSMSQEKLLLSLSDEALEGKTFEKPEYYFVKKIKAGTPFRLESLRNYSLSNKVTNRGLPCRFEFYVSGDNKNWTQVTDYWYHSAYFESDEFDVKDTYVINTPDSAKYVKVVFPQTQDYRLGTGDGNNNPVIDKNTVGNAVLGTVKSIQYSPDGNKRTVRDDDFAVLRKYPKARSNMYDASASVLSDEEKASDAAVFDIGESYYRESSSGNVSVLLSLTYEALSYLSTDEEIEDGYYITYNVEGDTLFKFKSYRTAGADKALSSQGLSYKFRIYYSGDHQNWTELKEEEYSLRIGSPPEPGNYDIMDHYSFVVPSGAKFIKLVFPQTKNLAVDGAFGSGSPGNWQCGTLQSVEYTPASVPAAPLRTEPAHSYGKILDCSKMLNVYEAYAAMYMYSSGQITLGESKYTTESVNDEGLVSRIDHPLLSLTYSALFEKESLESPYFLTFNVEPGTAFRLQSLRIHSTANKVAKKGRPVYFKFYVSSDNENWTLCTDTEIYTSFFDSLQYDTLDTYVVPTASDTKFVKVEFPQLQDNSDAFGKGSPGNWQLATIKEIAYTPASVPASRPPIVSDYDPNYVYGAVDLTRGSGQQEIYGTADDWSLNSNTGETADVWIVLLILVVSGIGFYLFKHKLKRL